MLLASAGLLLLLAVPPLLLQLLARPTQELARLSFPDFVVRNPAGAQIGTLSIDYPRSMRENESGSVVVRYQAPESWRRNFATRLGVRIEASLTAGCLAIVPDPPRHVFRNEAIARTGSDAQSWEAVPTVEGHYQLGLRLDVQPAGFSVGAIDVKRRGRGRRRHRRPAPAGQRLHPLQPLPGDGGCADGRVASARLPRHAGRPALHAAPVSQEVRRNPGGGIHGSWSDYAGSGFTTTPHKALIPAFHLRHGNPPEWAMDVALAARLLG